MGVHIHIHPDSSGGGSGGGGGEAAALATKITRAELLSLRNGGNLTPGAWYRITDYRGGGTNGAGDTQCAANYFDILVRADDETHLNENAYAAHHDGDTYFQNSKLEAWQLKYCIDNDTSRFAWADAQDGQGVVYYMKDEFGNECPYDFKNMVFARQLTTSGGKGGGDRGSNTVYCYTFTGQIGYDSYDPSGGEGGGGGGGPKASVSPTRAASATLQPQAITLKTIDRSTLDDGPAIYDASLNTLGVCRDNYIAPYVDPENPSTLILNNIVFINDAENPFFCCSNTFGSDCYDNTFGSYCFGNTFGSSCGNNSFGSNCRFNSFGSSCESNTFGSGCYNNTFGSNCRRNSFGSNCGNNSFGSECYNNTFGSGCYNNTFGSECCDNTFGSNILNTHVLNGTCANGSIPFVASASYSQYAGLDSKGTLRIWAPADLAGTNSGGAE